MILFVKLGSQKLKKLRLNKIGNRERPNLLCPKFLLDSSVIIRKNELQDFAKVFNFSINTVRDWAIARFQPFTSSYIVYCLTSIVKNL